MGTVERRESGERDAGAGAAAFAHGGPTGVGYVELDLPTSVRRPSPGSWAPGSRDALLMVRLHEEPLGFVHVDGPLETLANEAVAEAIYRQVLPAIRRHCERCGCREPPEGPDEILAGLGSPSEGCPGAFRASSAALVTVVVPTANRAMELARCLRSICDLRHPNFEVIVVDNRPHLPGTDEIVLGFADRLRVRYVAEPRPGNSVARNRGLVEAGSEIVAFVDDDAVVDEGWLDWLIEPFAEPAVTAVSGLILPLELQTETQKLLEQYLGGVAPDIVEHHYDLGANRVPRFLYPYWGGVFGSGPSMAFRRADLISAGGLDPALGAGTPARSGEDIEAFSAAVLRGGQCVYAPRAVCWHEHTRDMTYLKGQLFNFGVGLAAIMTKYLTSDPRFLVALVRSVPILLRTLLRRRREASPGGLIQMPPELARAGRAGLVQGPWLYLRSRRWARRLRLYDVVPDSSI